MYEQKIYKPNSCLECPVVKIEKNKIICGCYRSLTADIKDKNDQYYMWKKCHIDWDKKED